jgi:MurNAc alpha-1-phosphate uridylyltransferase
MIRTALVFAAGRGDRLRPLTDLVPKPMCLVRGIPLIERLIIQLAHAGIEHIVINHAYLGSQIRRHLKKGQAFGVDISYSPEPPGALETGGGIIQALPLLGSTPFMTVSSDIITDYPFSTLKLTENTPIHLVLVAKQPHTSHADFSLNAQQRIVTTSKTLTFGNIACFHPEIFEDRQLKRFRLTQLLQPFIEKQQVSGELYTGTWLDTGSVERLKQAQSNVS